MIHIAQNKMNNIPEIYPNRILYIDDQEENILLFTLMFSKKFNISCEKEPLKALDLIKNNNFRVVISDYDMPSMNGLELLEIVKNEYPEIIRIMLTSSKDYELEIEAKRRCDIHAFLVKPINKKMIEEILVPKHHLLNTTY